MAIARLCKAGREHLALTRHFAEQWANPPEFFLNPLYDAEKAARQKRMNEVIKDDLDKLHRELRHKRSDEYYDLMDAREAILKSRYDNEYRLTTS